MMACIYLHYDQIQSQGQGHGPVKFRKLHFSRSISSAIYNGRWQIWSGPDLWHLF